MRHPALGKEVEILGGPHDGLLVSFAGHDVIGVPYLRLFQKMPLPGDVVVTYRYVLREAGDDRWLYVHG